MRNFEWISPPVVLAEVGDPSGGLMWLLSDTVQTGDAPEPELPDVDMSALSTAGPCAYTWGGAA